MKMGLLLFSSMGLVVALAGCVERRVEYVPASQSQAVTAPNTPSYTYPPQTAYAPAPAPAQADAGAPPPAPQPDATVGQPAPSAPPVEAPATPPPAVAPPPPAGYMTYAPDYYTWDGYEYVGVMNGQYVYWGGGGWFVAPPAIVFRFHGWERYHPEWHRHAVPYRRGRFR